LAGAAAAAEAAVTAGMGWKLFMQTETSPRSGWMGRNVHQDVSSWIQNYSTLYACNLQRFVKGATTLSITTFNIMTLSIMTFNITTLSKMTFSITTLSTMTFSIIKMKCDTQHNGRTLLC
jgi:hypothetical protein